MKSLLTLITQNARGKIASRLLVCLFMVSVMTNQTSASPFLNDETTKADSLKKIEVAKNYILANIQIGKHFYGYQTDNYTDFYAEVGQKKLVGIVNINKRKFADYYNQDKIFAVGYRFTTKFGNLIPYGGLNLQDYGATRIYKTSADRVLLKQVGQFNATRSFIGLKGEAKVGNITIFLDRFNHFFAGGTQEVALREIINDWYYEVKNTMTVKHTAFTTAQARVDLPIKLKGVNGISIGTYAYAWMQGETNKFSIAPYVAYSNGKFTGNLSYMNSDNKSAFSATISYKFGLK